MHLSEMKRVTEKYMYRQPQMILVALTSLCTTEHLRKFSVKILVKTMLLN